MSFLLWMLNKYLHRYKICEVGFFFLSELNILGFVERLSCSMCKFLQVVFLMFLLFPLPPVTAAFSAVVNLVLQDLVDFCPLIFVLCVVVLSVRTVSLKLMSSPGGHMHRIVPKAGRCRAGGRGHESHCKYSAQGSAINSADVKCINISCWNVILMFLLCASGWLDCLTFKNSYLLQLSSLQAAVWVEYMGGCILFAFLMEYFILMDKIIYENNL